MASDEQQCKVEFYVLFGFCIKMLDPPVRHKNVYLALLGECRLDGSVWRSKILLLGLFSDVSITVQGHSKWNMKFAHP